MPNEKQSAIVDFALKQRRVLSKQCQDDEKIRAQQRQQKMADENAKREAMKKKLQEERERLSQLHLITSSSELEQDLHAIDEEMISTSKKNNKI